ncbi:MAG TPA: glycosyltransferase family 87 protein [Propionibacteriaceae bacterium]|nr:glycosyltransferase family 87 protein [Propionibacteriaceae bacterium]
MSEPTVGYPLSHAMAFVRRYLTDERMDRPRFALLLWIVTRLLVLAGWASLRFMLGDTRYYHAKISVLGEVGPELTMIEYPTPVLWLLKLPDLFAFGHRWAYVAAFVALMMAVDAAFALTLWRRGGRLRGPAVAFWALFIFAVGPMSYLRFDVVTAALAGWALISLLDRRPGLAGALVGVGAAIKLWPALLWPATLVGNRRDRLRSFLGIVLAGGGLALASLIWAGWDRLVSPLTWQSERGLQIESIWASAPMLWRALQPDRFETGVSAYQAWEIHGPLVEVMVTASTTATAVGMLAAVAAYIWWLVRGNQRLVEAAALMLLVIIVMIVTNKTFSPQYIIWLGGPLAASFAISARSPHGSPESFHDDRRLVRIGALLLVLTVATQLIYPIGYGPLAWGSPKFPHVLLVVMTVVLVARNVGMVWLLWLVVRWIWHFLRLPGGVRDAE